jgi:putative flippase GtrA
MQVVAVPSQFLRYLAAGGIAAAANYFSRFAFSAWVAFETAVVLAFFVGLITGFVLMRQFVFEGAGKPLAPQAVKYVMVNLVALVLTVGVSSLLARWLLPVLGVDRHVEAIAHAFGVAVPVLTSYVGHRLATFK